MRVKEYLNQPFKLKQEIVALEQELEEYRVLSVTTGAIRYDDEVKSTSGANVNAPFVKWLLKINEIEETIKSKKQELELLQLEVANAIALMPDASERTLLIARYVNCKTWGCIQSELFSSRATVYRTHTQALNSFQLINKS